MSWDIQVREGVVVAVMRSNRVNKMNPGFFDDLHAALDAVEKDHPRLPLVLTAEGSTFSAGLDFEDVFPRFAKNDAAELRAWFERFRGSLLRVFTLPRRTVAAINGNAFAGGLILALCCDVRIAAAGGARFAINEVPIGIPMPGVFTEIVRYAVGARSAAEAILGGQLYDVERALAAGFLHQAVPADQLLDEAMKQARFISPESFSAYAVSKRALIQPSLKWIAGDGAELDVQAMQAVMGPDSVIAQMAALDRLKKKP
jgi:enoyl-CoA hydratase